MHARPSRFTCVALASVAGFVLLCASASAAAVWGTAQGLSAAGENAVSTHVAVDNAGDSFAVWDFGPDGSMNHLVQAAIRPAGGSWQATPTNLATCFFFPTTPEIAVDAKGDAVAAFLCSANGSSLVIQVATRPAGGAWSQPVTVNNTADINVNDPQLAVAANGDATVAWLAPNSGGSGVIEAVQRPAGGTWSQPVAVSPSTTLGVGPPQLAMDPNGDVTAAWIIDNGVNDVAEASERPKGATAWSTPIDLSSADVAASNLRVAMTPQGSSIAIWQHGTGSGATIQAAVHPAGGQWHAPQNISASGELAESPELASDSLGNETAVWDRSNGSNTIVQSSELPAGDSSWQTPVNISAAGESATVPAVASDAGGDLVAVWERSNGSNTIVQASAHPAGAGWQTPQSLSSAGQNAENPQVAVDSRGNATAVWDRSNGTNTIAQAAGYDAGPVFTASTIPTTGTAGTAVAFSASPLGVWSSVTGTTWSFGDGQSATGTSVSHTYAAAGTYTVTVTSTDANGGTTSRSQTIAIAASGPPPPSAGGPKLTAVSEAHKKWRDGPKHGHKPPPSGTSFSFTVDQPARVSFAFTETTSGRKVKSKCQTPTKRNRKDPSCKRSVALGTLTETVAKGHHTIAFNGRVSGHKLPAGSYTVRITAANSSGKRSRTATLRFTVVS